MKIERDFDNNTGFKFITGKEFQNSGLLWFVNTILHLFGMAIAIDNKTGELKAALVTFRGFSENVNTDSYKKVSEYLLDNMNEIIKDLQ